MAKWGLGFLWVKGFSFYRNSSFLLNTFLLYLTSPVLVKIQLLSFMTADLMSVQAVQIMMIQVVMMVLHLNGWNGIHQHILNYASHSMYFLLSLF